jgi:hypothetical protein
MAIKADKAKPRTDNPLIADDDDTGQDVAERKAAELKEKLAHRAVEDGTEVVLEPPPETEDDDDEPHKPTWSEKRRNRYAAEVERANEAERRAREAEARAAALQVQMETSRQREQPTDEIGQRIAQIDQDIAKLTKEARSQKDVSEEYLDTYWQRMNALQEKRMEAVIDRRERAAVQRAPNFAQESLKAQLMTHFGDVLADRRATYYADGVMRQRLAEQGREHASWKDYEEVMDQARRKFGMAKSPTPSDAARQKFSGSSVGYSAPPKEEPNGRRTVKLTPDEMSMARTRFRKIRDPKTGQERMATEKEAYELFARRIVSKRA